MELPIPLDAPVIMTFFPEKLNFTSLFGRSASCLSKSVGFCNSGSIIVLLNLELLWMMLKSFLVDECLEVVLCELKCIAGEIESVFANGLVFGIV